MSAPLLYAASRTNRRRRSKAEIQRALCNDQAAYVEIWCEKDTLAGILTEETEQYDVPLMVARGFFSETYVFEASEQIGGQGKPALLYVLTDHDRSGLASAADVRRQIKRFLPEFPVSVERVAVTEVQISAWDLPTWPTKTSNSRSQTFHSDSVELDAIPPLALRALVRDCIERHIDSLALRRTRNIEDAERATLANLRAQEGLA